MNILLIFLRRSENAALDSLNNKVSTTTSDKCTFSIQEQSETTSYELAISRCAGEDSRNSHQDENGWQTSKQNSAMYIRGISGKPPPNENSSEESTALLALESASRIKTSTSSENGKPIGTKCKNCRSLLCHHGRPVSYISSKLFRSKVVSSLPSEQSGQLFTISLSTKFDTC